MSAVILESNCSLYINLITEDRAPAPPYDGLGNWELLGGLAMIAPLPGRFGAYSEITGTDVAPGGNVWLEVVGWNGDYSNVNDALSGDPSLSNWTSVWSQGTGNGTTIQPVSTTSYFPGLILYPPIPEPGTIALGGLGTAVILLFRRK